MQMRQRHNTRALNCVVPKTTKRKGSSSSGSGDVWGKVHVYLTFPRRSESENFAFSIGMVGANIPPITPHTEWIFIEAINTLKFVEPWDIDDFGPVLDHLKIDGYYLFQGKIIKPSLGKRAGVLNVGRLAATLFVESEGRVFNGTLRTRSTTVDAPPWYPGSGKAPVPPGAFSFGAKCEP